jgi:hypothetical protein
MGAMFSTDRRERESRLAHLIETRTHFPVETAALAPAPVITALELQGSETPAAQKYKKCLVCKERPARLAPPCGHVVLCGECVGRPRTIGAKRRKVTMRCPWPGCNIEFGTDSAFLVNRDLRDNEENIPPNEDVCGICLDELPILAHRGAAGPAGIANTGQVGCGVSYCASCWSSILNRKGTCPICKKAVTSKDIFRTYFGNFV